MNRPRPHWRTLIRIAAGVAAFAATAVLALTRNGGSQPALLVAPLTTLGNLNPARATGPLGPEDVPIPKATPLAPLRRLRVGEQIGGITCQTGEQVAFHIHAHLRIVVPLTRRQVGSARGAVAALFNGRVFTGSPRTIPLLAHSQIELEVGRPLVAPEKITFPHGL